MTGLGAAVEIYAPRVAQGGCQKCRSVHFELGPYRGSAEPASSPRVAWHRRAGPETEWSCGRMTYDGNHRRRMRRGRLPLIVGALVAVIAVVAPAMTPP